MKPPRSQGSPNKGTKSEVAASTLPSRGLKRGRKCYVTLAFSGVPKKGDKIRSGRLTLAFSGAEFRFPISCGLATACSYCCWWCLSPLLHTLPLLEIFAVPRPQIFYRGRFRYWQDLLPSFVLATLVILVFFKPSRERQCAGHLFGPLFMRSPNPRFLHGPFPGGDMDWPLSRWGYGLAPFQLGIWSGPFPVEDTHLQKPVLSCRASKGVRRRLGVKALLVSANLNHVVQEFFFFYFRRHISSKFKVSL